jgi:hypothetical protein
LERVGRRKFRGLDRLGANISTQAAACKYKRLKRLNVWWLRGIVVTYGTLGSLPGILRLFLRSLALEAYGGVGQK